jgi:myo-inositol-hexaphosphate 3-phosphohydrolase
MVPYPATSIKDLSANREDGILTVHDMSTRDYLKFYNDNKYWNLDLKDEFLG